MTTHRLSRFRPRAPVSMLMAGVLAVGLILIGGSSTAGASHRGSLAVKKAAIPRAYRGTIGALILVEADEQGIRCLRAIQKEGAALGYKVTDIDAGYDPSKEIAGMNTFINEKVNGIITFATDDVLLAPEIKRAAAAHIPVIALTGGPVVPGLTWSLDMPESVYSSAVETLLFKDILRSGRDRTAVEMVLPSAVPCRRREAAFEQTAKAFPQIKLIKYGINGTNPVEDAYSYFSTYLLAHPNLGGVVSCWDIPVTGLITAATADDISTSFTVTAINGSSDSVARMQNGQPYLKADVGIHLAMASYDATVQLVNLLQGKKTTIPTSRYSTMKWDMLTPGNLPPKGDVEFPSWLPTGWKPNYWK
jgi:ABC-type sugar transport system substrate-binding protein